jgi:hypothetical protein
MKSILSAAALLVAIAAPAVAGEVTTQPQAAPAVVEIVPTATDPAMSVAPAAAVEGEAQSKAPKAAMGGHGCGSKQTVYLTN